MIRVTYNQIIFLLAIFSTLIFTLSLYQRWITLDDAWFAEQAYWFAKNGYVRSELFSGFLDYEVRQFVYHKLHIWQGALAIRLFSFDPYVFKSISLVYIGLFLFFIRHYMVKNNFYHNYTFAAFVLFFFSNNLILQHGFEYRPELGMMFSGFISYFLLEKSITLNKRKLTILAGLFAGITALYHLNGLIFIAAGSILLLINKKYLFSVLFMLGAVIGISPYFFEIINPANLQMHIFQFKNDPALSKDEFTILGWIKKLAFEPKRYMHHTYEFFYLIALIMTVSFNWDKIKKNTYLKTLFIYFLLLTAFTGLLTPGSKTVYLLYTFPFATLLISILLRETIENKKSRVLAITVTFLFLVTNIGHVGSLFDKRNSEIVSLHKTIMNKYSISKNSEIVAPLLFIFNEIENVKIQGFHGYNLARCRKDNTCHFRKITFTASSFLKDCYAANKSYVILTDANLTALKFKPVINHRYDGYKYMGNEHYYHIFKKI